MKYRSHKCPFSSPYLCRYHSRRSDIISSYSRPVLTVEAGPNALRLRVINVPVLFPLTFDTYTTVLLQSWRGQIVHERQLVCSSATVCVVFRATNHRYVIGEQSHCVTSHIYRYFAAVTGLTNQSTPLHLWSLACDFYSLRIAWAMTYKWSCWPGAMSVKQQCHIRRPDTASVVSRYRINESPWLWNHIKCSTFSYVWRYTLGKFCTTPSSIFSRHCYFTTRHHTSLQPVSI